MSRMYPRTPLPCDGFTASVQWGGTFYTTVCYEVVVKVDSLDAAVEKRAKILAAIRDTRPTWRVISDRLVADELGRAVYLYVDVNFEDPSS